MNKKTSSLNNAKIFNLLGRKAYRCQASKQKSEEINSTKIFEESRTTGSKRTISDNNCNFKLKQNKNRIHRNKKKENNLIFPVFNSLGVDHRHKSNSALSFDDKLAKPKAPHNTSQYLIENFAVARKEKMKNVNPFALIFERYQAWDGQSMGLNEIEDIDDICITGGSMKGIINSTINILPTTEMGIDLDIDYNMEIHANRNLPLPDESKQHSSASTKNTEEFSTTDEDTANFEELQNFKQTMIQNERKIKELEEILKKTNLQYEYS